MKKVTLNEAKAPYTLAIDEETLAQEAVILEQDGRPVAVLLPLDEYEAFQAWRQTKAGQSRRSARQQAFAQERASFAQMKSELLKAYRGQVVAIYQGKIVEVGSDIGQTVEKVYDRFGYVPCYLQRVEESPPVYKLPHRKIIR